AAQLQAGQALNLDFEWTDLGALVNDAMEGARIAHGDRFHLRCPDAPVMGRFAAAGIVRSLENLISNAAKYGEPDSAITVMITDEATYARLTVHNQGEPIPPAQCDRLFEIFYRAREPDEGQRGWGIGLGVVRAVAEA